MGRNPIYGFIAFLLVEGLVSFGFLNREMAGEAQARIEEIVFYVGLSLTAAFGFQQYISAHKHHVTKESETYQDSPVVETGKEDPAPIIKTQSVEKTTSNQEPLG